MHTLEPMQGGIGAILQNCEWNSKAAFFLSLSLLH